MLILLSPAKTLDMESDPPSCLAKYPFGEPELKAETRKLIGFLRKLSAQELCKLMSVSVKIGDLNHRRFQEWKPSFSLKNARPALLAFRGDVYRGLELASYKAGDYDFAQEHVRVLSGLYGVLRPLDLMQAYRLEMGTKLANGKNKNLYEFWGNRITRVLNADLKKEKSGLVLNLASQEYFKSVRPEVLEGKIISPVFKEKKNGALKIVSVNAKRARGLMTDFIIKKRITTPAQILKFNSEGYRYQADLSTPEEPLFVKS